MEKYTKWLNYGAKAIEITMNSFEDLLILIIATVFTGLVLKLLWQMIKRGVKV